MYLWSGMWCACVCACATKMLVHLERERGGKKNEGELMYGHIYIMFNWYNIYGVHHVYIYNIFYTISISMSIYILYIYMHTHTLTQLFHMFPQLDKLGPRAYRPHRLHPQEWPQPRPMKSVKVSLDQKWEIDNKLISMPCWNDEIYIDLQNQASFWVWKFWVLWLMILYGSFGKSLATP